MKQTSNYFLLALLLTVPADAAVLNLVVTGYAAGSLPIFNTSTDIPGGGTSANTVAAPVGSFVDFTIGNADAIVGDEFLATNINTLPTVATLRVTISALSAGSEFMLARTSNSQGLTDVGTFSFLLNGAANLAQSATLQFEWRNADNNALLDGADQFLITTYDIDFSQRNSIAVADYESLQFAASTVLDSSTSAGITSIFDPGNTNADFDNPLNGALIKTVAGDNTQTISVDKLDNAVGNQLYMFSFRSPSPLIPEPGTVTLALMGAMALLRRRR